MKIKRLLRAGHTGPLDHWEAPGNPGVALCGISPVGRTSGVFDVLPYGQLNNPYNNVETLAIEAVDCPECRAKFAELAKEVNNAPVVRAEPVVIPSRARFEATQTTPAGEEEGCVMCSG
jgi:hypothetical protein